MFWRVFKRFPEIFAYKDKLSYPELQEIYAIVNMENDYQDAYMEYEDQRMDESRNYK